MRPDVRRQNTLNEAVRDFNGAGKSGYFVAEPILEDALAGL